MRVKEIVLTVLLICCLTGCSKKEEEIIEPVIETPPLTEVMTSCDFKDIRVNAIGTWCGFTVNDSSMEIHPFYDSPKHIKVERILLSDKPYWKTIKSSLSGAIVTQCSIGEMITLSDGRSYAYVQADADYAYVLFTDSLPSSYIKAVLDRLELTNL